MELKGFFLLPLLLLLLVPQDSRTSSVISFVKPGTIRVGDRSLTDWDGVKPIRSLNQADQWRALNCGASSRSPNPSRPDQIDLQGSFYLAWDGSNLFFAVDVVDDAVLTVPSADKRPWRGDSAELFFVAECESKSDYHDCAQLGKPVFQMILCPNDLQDKRHHLADYRTPKSVIEKTLQNGFQASGWKTENGWQAEAIFPLAALDNGKAKISGGTKVRVAFDVLDYDRRLAIWRAPCWGFEPDHVVSNVGKQDSVSIPTIMSEFTFEIKK